jgi:hypothetical protein
MQKRMVAASRFPEHNLPEAHIDRQRVGKVLAELSARAV